MTGKSPSKKHCTATDDLLPSGSGCAEGPVVAGHLDVSLAADGNGVEAAGDVDGALPIRHARRAAGDELLITQQRLEGDVDTKRRDDDAPAHGISRTALRRVPRAYGRDLHLVVTEVDDAAVAGDERAGGGHVGCAVAAAEQVEHQFRVVVELEGEPVPSLLVLPLLRPVEFGVR